MHPVNLFSDTQTRPSDGMRQAIAAAEVGDEQRGLDPTVNALQERVAGLLGHEAALFLPTGTMCNEIAFRLHVRAAGDEILLDRYAHPIIAEAGGPAALAGAMLNPIDGDGGVFTARAARGGPAAGEPLHAPLAAPVGGADHQHLRRPRVAARDHARASSRWLGATGFARTSTARAC